MKCVKKTVLFSCFALFISLMLLLCSCGKKKDVPANADTDSSVPQSDTASDSSEYSTSSEDLMGTWGIAYCSDDNVTYTEYDSSGTDDGIFTFYADGICVLSADGAINTYHYDISEERGTIAFSDIDSGDALDFYFGYGILADKQNIRLIVTRYCVTDHSVKYYILTAKTWL